MGTEHFSSGSKMINFMTVTVIYENVKLMTPSIY